MTTDPTFANLTPEEREAEVIRMQLEASRREMMHMAGKPLRVVEDALAAMARGEDAGDVLRKAWRRALDPEEG